MKICESCIIPSSFSEAQLENGICIFCRNHVNLPRIKNELFGEHELFNKLATNKHCKYHCLIGLSGGKDSSYILYYITKKLGLNPLAAFFDNGFTSKYAKENIKNMCIKLNVDLVIGNATKFRKKSIKENFKMSKYYGNFDACINCENNLRAFVINEARKKNIPYIVYGATDYEESYTTFLNSSTPTFRTIRSKHKFNLINTIKKIKWTYFDPLLYPLKLGDKLIYYYHFLLLKYFIVRDNIRMKSPECLKTLLPSMHVSFDDKNIEGVYFFDYIKYNPKEMIRILQKEVGWKAPHDREIRMDCRIGCFANYQHLQKKGITKDGFTLSVLVRNGLMNREEALEKEKALQKNLREECEIIVKELIS